MIYPCNRCGKYGHWLRDHNNDGSLPPAVKSVDNGSSAQTVQNSNNQNSNRTLSFNMALLTGSSASTINNTLYQHGPLVDDGAPYSAIGLVELKVLASQLRLSQPIKLEKIPESLNDHTHWQYGTGDHSSATRKY